MRPDSCPWPSEVAQAPPRSLGLVLGAVPIDACLQHVRRLEHHDPARLDRHFDAGFRVAADALALVAHEEGAERGQLHDVALGQPDADLLEHALDQRSRLAPRQPKLLINGLTEIGPCHCPTRHAAPKTAIWIEPMYLVSKAIRSLGAGQPDIR